MGRQRKDELWSESVGERPNTVRVREEKKPGDIVYLRWSNPDGTPGWRSLETRVRDDKGRLLRDACNRALEAGKDKSAELRIERLRHETVMPAKLTVGQAFDRFHDPLTGRRPKSDGAWRNHRNAAKLWRNVLGEHTPWNQITPAQVEAAAFRIKAEGKGEWAVMAVKVLRACFYWLRNKAKMRGLDNPVEGFGWEELKKGLKPRRKRYTPDELRALLKVRDAVDPRFALFLALDVVSGARGASVRTTWRSAVDGPSEYPPDQAQAPHGWIVLPGLKAQEDPVVFLTQFARRELDRALTGYLRELEERYQADGVDYPLFPGAHKQGEWDTIRPTDARAYKPITPSPTKDWLRDAEELAGIEHQEWRAWHGIRRSWSDRIYEEHGLDTVTAAGAWASRDVPERIYLDRKKHKDRAKAREAMEHFTGPDLSEDL